MDSCTVLWEAFGGREVPYSDGELMGRELWARNREDTERVWALGDSSGMCGFQQLQKDVRKVFL